MQEHLLQDSLLHIKIQAQLLNHRLLLLSILIYQARLAHSQAAHW